MLSQTMIGYALIFTSVEWQLFLNTRLRPTFTKIPLPRSSNDKDDDDGWMTFYDDGDQCHDDDADDDDDNNHDDGYGDVDNQNGRRVL